MGGGERAPRGRREATAGAQDTMMNVIALSGWQTLGLLDFYQLLLLLPDVARRLRDRRGDFSRNSSRNYTANAASPLAR